MNRRYLFIILVAAWLGANPSSSKAVDGIGYHAAAFLKIHPTARQVAMGNAFTGLADDINLMRYNVGALGNIRNVTLAAHFHNWIEDTQQGSFSVSLPARYGVVGVDFSYFNEGDIVELDDQFRRTGGIASSDDVSLSMGYGNYLRLLNNDFSFGGAVKILRQTLVGQQTTAYGLDLGAQFRLKHLSFGATLQNFGLTKVKFDEQESSLPETYRVGMAARLPLGSEFKFNLAADAAWTRDQELRYYTGGEMMVSDLIALRGGYKIHEFEASRWSAGFGVFIPMEWLANSETRLDYAYSPVDVFDAAVHRFSLLFRFGVAQRVFALNYRDREDLDAMSDRLRRELEAAEKARLAAEQAEERMRLLEEEMARRLARIKSIAAESEGKIEVAEPVDNQILVSLRINFDFDKAVIRPEEYSTMGQVADILNTYPEAMFHISGHTDSIGTHLYNIRLSQRRIDSVMDFLAERENVADERFYMPVGYGELRPVADNGNPDGRFRNRRVEFLLYTADTEPTIPEGSAIKDIQVVSADQVRIMLNGTADFQVKTLSDPNRLIVDMPMVFLLNDKTTYEINRGPFIRARLGYHPDKMFSRVVFDLNAPVPLEVRSVGQYIIVERQ